MGESKGEDEKREYCRLNGGKDAEDKNVSMEKPDGPSYPLTVISQRQVLGFDMAYVELLYIPQELLATLEETASVFFRPLQTLIAQSWVSQGRSPVDNKDARLK